MIPAYAQELWNCEGGSVIRQRALTIILSTLAVLSATLGPAASSQSSAPGFINTLMPQPSQFSTQEGHFAITPSFTVVADHFRDARLDAAIARNLDRIKTQTAILIATSAAVDKTSATLVISVNGPGETIQSVDEDE